MYKNIYIYKYSVTIFLALYQKKKLEIDNESDDQKLLFIKKGNNI